MNTIKYFEEFSEINEINKSNWPILDNIKKNLGINVFGKSDNISSIDAAPMAATPVKDYRVSLKTRFYYPDGDINIFIEKLKDDGFEILHKWAFTGIIYIKNNGELHKLEEYPEVDMVTLI